MNRNHGALPHLQNDEDFCSFADAVIAGNQPDARTEIESTFLRVQRTLGQASLARSAMPDADRTALKEEFMSSHAYPNTRHPQILSIPVEEARRHNQIIGNNRWERIQATVSIAAVVALLIAMSALVHERGFHNQEPNSPGNANLGQAMYDGDDEPSYPLLPTSCIANGPVQDDAVYLEKSIKDWPAPQYGPVQAVTPEIGEHMRQTYLNFLRCQRDLFPASSAASPPADGTPVVYRSLQTDSYLSDRARFVMLGDGVFASPQLDAERQADLHSYLCTPGSTAVLSEFPIPVNKPPAYVATALTPDGIPTELMAAFSATDVYRLPDGRFGAILGSISMDALNDPSSIETSDLMTLIAFVEEDGRYLIDEQFLVEIPGMPEPDRFDPCELSWPD